MESSLHRALKRLYGPDRGGREEVAVAGYRIDAVGPGGELVEVQSGSLAPLRAKLARLLGAGHRARVVKPVALRRRIIRRATPLGPIRSARFSPKRGTLVDVFDDLVGLARLLPEPGLTLEVLGVVIEETRAGRRGLTVDRALIEVVERVAIDGPADLWRLLPGGLPEPFTTLDLASALGRPDWFARKVAYCLRESGAAFEVGKVGNRRVYGRGERGDHEGTKGTKLPQTGRAASAL